mgnify:CR=1 FL=1
MQIRPFGAVILMVALAGCGPSNLSECRMEAAKMPTERGVSLAAMACHQKFPQPPAPGEAK